MLRIILVASTVVLFLIFSIPILGILALVGKGNSRAKQDWSLRIVRSVFRFILKLAGVTITVQGLENIPRDRAVLYVGNHRSYFDILTGYVTVPGLTGFVAKKEMVKIPLLSTWMSYVNCLFLDRVNIKEGLKTILEGIEKVKSGVSILYSATSAQIFMRCSNRRTNWPSISSSCPLNSPKSRFFIGCLSPSIIFFFLHLV